MGQTKSGSNGKKNQGQVALEYVLLMVIAVGVSMLIIRSLVYRSTDSPGVVIRAWSNIITAIGEDRADTPAAPE